MSEALNPMTFGFRQSFTSDNAAVSMYNRRPNGAPAVFLSYQFYEELLVCSQDYAPRVNLT